MQDWDPVLGEYLHEYLDYRANIILREKVQAETQSGNNSNPFTKVENKKASNKRMTDKDGEQKVVYCLEFNTNTCAHHDHHPGRFGGKNMTKFHVCRKCHQAGEIKSHKEMDNCCPRKTVNSA